MIFRRKMEKRTNYRKRRKMILSRMPALYIRVSNKNVYAQVLVPEVVGDRTAVQANSKELQKAGWTYGRKSFPSAYLVGLLIGKRAIKGGLKEVLFYSGNNVFKAKTKLTGVIKGAVEAGLKVRCDDEIFPEDDAVNGERIVKYAAMLKAKGYKGQQFSMGLAKVEEEGKAIKKLKEAILSGEVS